MMMTALPKYYLKNNQTATANGQLLNGVSLLLITKPIRNELNYRLNLEGRALNK